ncbi:MAG: class I SAM-dependent methyltransferase [Candidatus Kryptoniota bacterium]
MHDSDLKKFYDQQAVRQVDPATYHLMWYRFYTMMNMIRGKRLSILEIGAGDGDIVFTLTKKGHSCFAMDISDIRLKRYEAMAHQQGIRQLLGNVEEKIPLENESLDAVLCGEIIEHVPDNDKAIEEIRRVLKRNGQFILSVPYKETLKITKCPDCGKQFELNGYLHTYDKQSVRSLLEQHGFAVVETHIGHTKFSREIWKRWHSSAAVRLCHLIDKLTYGLFKASDTWIMTKGIKKVKV